MSFRRIDMKTLNKKDRGDYKMLSRRFSWCDHNIAFPYLKEIGILLTSHPGNRAYLKASVESHAKTKLWITLAYDNYFDPDRKELTWNQLMPDKEVVDNVNSFIMGPYQKWGGVLYPYFWLLELGLNSMNGFKYIYSANGDCIIEKPEGVFELLEILKKEDADFIAAGWWNRGDSRYVFNSTGFIGKAESIMKMMKHFRENFIPLKSYERTCQDFGNCEGRMGRAIKDLGMKVVKVENPENEQMHIKGIGTWYKIAGFRHLHAEEGMAWKMRNSVPKVYCPELKYIDERYMNQQELEFMKNNQPPC